MPQVCVRLRSKNGVREQKRRHFRLPLIVTHMKEGSYRLHHGNEKQKLTLTTENNWLVYTKFVLEENDFVCEYVFASSSEAMTQGDDIRKRTELETCHPRAKILRSTESSPLSTQFLYFCLREGW